MSTPLRRTVRNAKFALAPSVKRRVQALTQPTTKRTRVLPAVRVIVRAKLMGSAANREARIKELEKEYGRINKRLSAIEGKKGTEELRGKLITQSMRLHSRLLEIRNPKAAKRKA
ncbi:MAG: hypothetical protein WCW44_03845 [archaeon]|jgi:hypothetical protein